MVMARDIIPESGWHSNTATGAAVSQLEQPRFNPDLWFCLSRACAFSFVITWAFSGCASFLSHSQHVQIGRLTGHCKLPLANSPL